MIVNQDTANTLPTGWAKCSIGQVTLPVSKIDPGDDPDRGIDYIDISSIDNTRHVIGNVKQYRLEDAPSRARQIVCSSDVLFATVRPYLRNIAAVPNDYDQQIASTGFSVLRPAEGVCPAFLFYKAISRDLVNALSGIQYGVSYPAVKDEQVRDQPLWLPPLSEQHRIVAKIKELFSELDKGVESLKTAREQLKVYRQSILKHAFEGKLTAQWRKENKDKLEKPEQLLARIKQERAARYEQLLKGWRAAVKEWEDGGKPGKKPPRPKKPPEIADIPEDVRVKLPQLPSGWAHTSLEAVCQILDSRRIPVNNSERSRRIAGRSNGEIYPYYGATGQVGVIDDFIFEGEHILLGEDGAPFLDPFKPKAYLVRGKFWVNNHAHILKSTVSNRYVCHYLNQIGYSDHVTGTTRLKLTKNALRRIPVSVAPAEEQREVASILEKMLSIVDETEADIIQELQKSDALRQSILKKAFAGQLVAQDPTDEPASILLERIKAEQEQATNKATRKTTEKRTVA